MAAAAVIQVRQALARLTTGESPTATPAERAAWADALIDGGAVDAAADQVVTALRGDASLPDELLAVVRRLTGEHAAAALAAAIDGGHVNALSYDIGLRPPTSSAFAHLAVGCDETEDALLRAVLVVNRYEDLPHGRPRDNRIRRIASVLQVLSDAHRGEPERLDRWARILGDADRPRLAGAAGLLAPLGLAEIDRRCGVGAITGAEGVPLAGALAEVGRVNEALDLAARFEPQVQQQALVAAARAVTGERDARALVAAFRACPKGGRDRDRQMVYQHRFAQVLLGFGRVDDALDRLAKMRDCRIVSFGPAPFAWELVQWLDQRPDEVTGQRLRAVLDVLESTYVIAQELAAYVAPVLRRVFVLADPALRTEMIDVRVPRLRARLYSGDRAIVDSGLAAGLVAAGRVDEADAFLRDAVQMAQRGRPQFNAAKSLIEAAADAGLVDRDPDLFAKVLGTLVARTSSAPWMSPVLGRLGPTGRATAARLLDRLPQELATEWASCLAGAESATGELDTLLALLETAADEASALIIGRRIAMALARRGVLADARAVAATCGLCQGALESAASRSS